MKTTISTLALATALTALPAFADTAETDTMSAPVSQEAPAAWQPEDGDQIVFNVLRKGKEFGTHKISFDVESDDTFTARSDVELKAGLGPITVFKYELDATETWENGKLVGLKGQTNDDGDDEYVEASVDGDSLVIDGSAYSGDAPIGIIPSSHWNIQQAFSSQILSTETGELLDTNVEKIGRETLTIGGEEVETTHYRLQSDLTVDLWYDDKSRWVKLGFEARGQQIDYVLTQLY
ncbi:hypothetical protein D1224_00565 [Henriciella barbarensis]|uniref:DUF3108 domain-containing protein n=1 Tax=Henriciella barbarensis TaxID=86342 RepID=A0A399R7X9_9PROT|nr:DUF6134 family protein [Henriciella barbarensis]RIJ26145.1 hypothetical protein D1224_00565 [Henriciella barbarensis]